MLAAAFKRDHAYNLLLNPYSANPDLRDYSGKKAGMKVIKLLKRCSNILNVAISY